MLFRSGVDLAFSDIVLVVVTSVLASIGAAGIPSAGLVTMVIVITAVNSTIAGRGIEPLPIAAIGVIIGVDRLVDAMKNETDVAKRNGMIRDALVRLRDEVWLIPIHHQIRPWVMKQGVTTVHRSDDRPEARFTSIK